MESLMGGVDKTFSYSGRLETYAKWPFKPEDGSCTSERMAAAGFFVVDGQDDDADVSVECFICAKQLDGWEPKDDPWQEHAKHQADCPYVILNKQDEKEWTVDELFAIMKVYYVNRCTRMMEERLKNLKFQSQSWAKKIPKIYKTERNSRKIGKRE